MLKFEKESAMKSMKIEVLFFINGFSFSLFLYRYPGTTFMDHVMRYHDNPDVKMVVVLGEVKFEMHRTPCMHHKQFHTMALCTLA